MSGRFVNPPPICFYLPAYEHDPALSPTDQIRFLRSDPPLLCSHPTMLFSYRYGSSRNFGQSGGFFLTSVVDLRTTGSPSCGGENERFFQIDSNNRSDGRDVSWSD